MADYMREYRRGGPQWMYEEEYDFEFGGRGSREWVHGMPRGAPPYPRRLARSRDYGVERGYERRRPGYARRPAYGASRYAYGERRPWEAEYDYDFPGPERVAYGHTPPDRWPGTGHDLDHPLPGEDRLTDEEIREAVLDNLFDDTWIDPDRIDVSVEDGVVTLRGEVSDFMEARYAWDDAWETPGVRGVINHLTVRADLPGPEMMLPQTSGRYSRRSR